MASRAETSAFVPRIATDLAKQVGAEIVGRIGSGTLGELYRASVNRRTVALKVFHAGAPVDVSILERFLQSRDDALHHPNLMPLFAVSSVESRARTGRDSGTRILCTMPLLAGDPLDVVMADLEKGRSSQPSLAALAVGPGGEIHSLLPRRAAQLFAEVADGLSLAHQEGMVHGRLHPRTLIFSPAGRLVITDFGAPAGRHDDHADYLAPEEREKRTPSGVGSSETDLPESLPGRSPVTTTADVYALGTILQQVLAHGERLRAGQIPKALAACVWKATAREPRDRYERASDFAADLRRFLTDGEPLAVLERELFEAETRKRESSRARDEQLEQAAQLESATHLLAEERAGRERLRHELEEERRKRAQDVQARRARDTEMTAVLHERGRRLRWAAVAMLSSTTALLVWALVEADLRRTAVEQASQIREQASQIRALVEGGNVERALEETRVAGARRPDDQVAGALTLLARNTAAKEALVGAVRAVADNRIDSAASAVRAAASYIEPEEGTTLESLGLKLEQSAANAARDPVLSGLESAVGRDRLIALDHLELDIRQGSRPHGDALLALTVIPMAPPASLDKIDFARALRVAALAGESAPILGRLGIGDDRPAVAMAEDRFLALNEALETIADETALSLLCAWTARDRRTLDTARAPAQVFMAPNVLVEVDRDRRGDYAERWFDLVVPQDPRELLPVAEDVAATPDLLPRLIDALAATDSEWSHAVLVNLVRTRPLVAGGPGLSALRRVGAFEALLDIARGDFPLELRRAALEEIEIELFPLCLDELRAIALTSPHRELRRAAFRALSRSDSPAATSAIAVAVDDTELRDQALQWLVRLPPERSATEALALLEHPKGDVRRAAVSVLSDVSDASLLLPLTARLFAESPGVRAAALSLLKEKAALLGKQGHPEQPGDLVNRVLKFLGYPFRSPFRSPFESPFGGRFTGPLGSTGPLGKRGALSDILPVSEWWSAARAVLIRAAGGLVDAEKRRLWVQALARWLESSDDDTDAR